MIFSLEIENFYSFRSRETIDLRVSSGAKDGADRLITWPGLDASVPAAVGFFGANGSGKSNVLRALWFVTSFVRESFQWPPGRGIPYLRFNHPEAYHSSSAFAVEFPGPSDPTNLDTAKERTTYRYELEFTVDEMDNVARERLAFRAPKSKRWTRLFDRSGKNVTASPAFGVVPFQKIVDNALRSDASLISTLSQAQHPLCSWIVQAAGNVNSNIEITKRDWTDEDRAKDYLDDADLLDALNKEIVRLDIGIKSVAIDTPVDGDRLQKPIVRFAHDGHMMPLNILFESHGTRQFFRIFPIISRALRTGGIAILDELDCSIHPLLLPEIVSWFYDRERNRSGAQLWMSCQAASLLDDLTKEEIFFCEKDSLGQTSVYGLRDIASVRRNDNYYRKYLGGVYGAVPRLG